MQSPRHGWLSASKEATTADESTGPGAAFTPKPVLSAASTEDWGASVPARLTRLGPTTVIGVSVETNPRVFGAAGAVLFILLSGLVLARLTASRTRVA